MGVDECVKKPDEIVLAVTASPLLDVGFSNFERDVLGNRLMLFKDAMSIKGLPISDRDKTSQMVEKILGNILNWHPFLKIISQKYPLLARDIVASLENPPCCTTLLRADLQPNPQLTAAAVAAGTVTL